MSLSKFPPSDNSLTYFVNTRLWGIAALKAYETYQDPFFLENAMIIYRSYSTLVQSDSTEGLSTFGCVLSFFDTTLTESSDGGLEEVKYLIKCLARKEGQTVC